MYCLWLFGYIKFLAYYDYIKSSPFAFSFNFASKKNRFLCNSSIYFGNSFLIYRSQNISRHLISYDSKQLNPICMPLLFIDLPPFPLLIIPLHIFRIHSGCSQPENMWPSISGSLNARRRNLTQPNNPKDLSHQKLQNTSDKQQTTAKKHNSIIICRFSGFRFPFNFLGSISFLEGSRRWIKIQDGQSPNAHNLMGFG